MININKKHEISMTVYLHNEVALFHRIYFFLFIYSEQDIKNEVFSFCSIKYE